MTGVSDEDPEVVADLRLRAATERDTTRTREIPKWERPKITDQVPCRNRCGSLVDWTAEAEEAFVVFNQELAKRNESPLDKTRIVFCAACRAKGAAITAANCRKHVDLLADKIRKLKAGVPPSEECELIEQIKKLNHPNLSGLLASLSGAGSGKRKVRTADVL